MFKTKRKFLEEIELLRIENDGLKNEIELSAKKLKKLKKERVAESVLVKEELRSIINPKNKKEDIINSIKIFIGDF